MENNTPFSSGQTSKKLLRYRQGIPLKSMHSHFSSVAQNYRELRTTDLEPILYIRNELQHLPKIKAAEFGCGAGRYTLKLFQYLGEKLFLCCIDYNKEMLQQVKEYLTLHNIKNFRIKHCSAEDIRLNYKFLDCIFTFNSIHHFRMSEFLNTVAGILIDNGYLFVYTRLRGQNRMGIWGRHFPSFNQKETRLYELEELESIIEELPGLKIKHVETFNYNRVSSMQHLVTQASCNHYSTFCLYSNDEFRKSLNGFVENLRSNYSDISRINWTDSNTLFVIKKEK